MQPSLYICIHAILQAGLNAKVKIKPGYEHFKKVIRMFLCGNIYGTAYLHKVGIKMRPLIVPSVNMHEVADYE